MTTLNLENVREPSFTISETERHDSSSINYKKAPDEGAVNLKLPKGQSSVYERSNTNRSVSRSGVRNEDSIDYLEYKKHRCIVKRPSYL